MEQTNKQKKKKESKRQRRADGQTDTEMREEEGQNVCHQASSTRNILIHISAEIKGQMIVPDGLTPESHSETRLLGSCILGLTSCAGLVPCH